MISLGIYGPTGAVGRELLKLLEQKSYHVHLFGSQNSAGCQIPFQDRYLTVEPLDSKKKHDFAILCTDSIISKQLAPKLIEQGTVVIDHSSAFRMDPKVPLVIPEINAHALLNHQGLIASPNCTTTIMLLPLAPLHAQFGIKRIVAATYQAASGAGQTAVNELLEETRAFLEKKPFIRQVMPHAYAFNLFTHNSPLTEEGYVEEEMKMLHETRKILEDTQIQVTATCVRVPVLRAHSEALNIEFHKPFSKSNVLNLIANAPGVTLLEDWAQNRFPMPNDASHKNAIFCGRVRIDHSQPNTLEMFVVGDQLLKGAALNSLQILEHLL